MEDDDRYKILFTPKDIPSNKKDLIIAKLVQQLKTWARDTTLDHQKAVRKMYVTWHPDRQRADPAIN
jgi:hypothetical protein